MSTGTLDFTLVSATISRDADFDFEPIDTYATIRCIREQRSTRTARDQGRLPVWNESFTFSLEEGDLSRDILVHIYGVKSDLDELLGLARISILTAVGSTEGTLCCLNCPDKGEVGQLKASWRWTPAAKGISRDVKPQMELHGIDSPTSASGAYLSSSFDLNVPLEAYKGHVSYPYLSSGSTKSGEENTLTGIADGMANLGLGKEYSGRSTPSAPPYVEANYSSRGVLHSSESTYPSGVAHPLRSSGAGPFSAYPLDGAKKTPSLHTNSISNESQAYSSYPNVNIMMPVERNDVERQLDIHTATVYPAPQDSFQYNYPHLEHDESRAYVSKNKGKDKNHEADIPYKHAAPVHGGYPPPPPASYSPGYPPAHPPPPPHGHPPMGYPPPAYSQVPVHSPTPHGYPPAPNQYAYPPAPDHYTAPSYPPSYGYPPSVYGTQHHIPEPTNLGHNLAYTAAADVGHYNPEKYHKKHDKHDKKDKKDKKDKHDKHDKKDKKDKHDKKHKH